MKIIHILDRHRTWLEIESIGTVRNHTIVRNGRMTDILSQLTLKDVERIISTATYGVVHPDLSPLPLYTCYTYYDK